MPSNFKILAEYFVIPLLVLCISYAISGQFNLKYSAGTDFFIFFFSADIGAMIEVEDLHTRINPQFADQYLAVFGVLLTMSVFFIVVSGLTQRKLEAWREQQQQKKSWMFNPHDPSAVKYPLWGVIGCWIATIALMPTHLYVFFGKG